jgi:stearoyl-CoA desaturase (delta-9 desaturase)
VLVLVLVPFVATLYAIWLLWEQAVSWQDLTLLLATYVPISLGVTIGYHRMLAHRGFRAHPVARAGLLILGSMALEGAAIDWAAKHIKHHAFSDRKGDPHSPLEGLFHAHLGWLFRGEWADPQVYVREALRDPVARFVDRTFLLWAGLGLLIPWVLGGWTGLLWGGLVRSFLIHHVTWSVNSICHTFGRRAYRTTDRSYNNWMIGLLAFGEGWHNNHHAFPRSAVHGLDQWQFDLSAWLIGGLVWLRLASEVSRPAPETLVMKRLAQPR